MHSENKHQSVLLRKHFRKHPRIGNNNKIDFRQCGNNKYFKRLSIKVYNHNLCKNVDNYLI